MSYFVWFIPTSTFNSTNKLEPEDARKRQTNVLSDVVLGLSVLQGHDIIPKPFTLLLPRRGHRGVSIAGCQIVLIP